MSPIPSLEEFLAAPLEEVAQVAPQTLIFQPSGTRRRAVLAGIDDGSFEYVAWSRQQMIACERLIFQHGVQHIVSLTLGTKQLQEKTRNFSEKLMEWADWVFTNPEAMADYKRYNWQVRLIGANAMPAMQAIADKLAEATKNHSGPHLWLLIFPDEATVWTDLLACIHQSQAQTQTEVIRAYFGFDIPPASMFLGFGKPELYPSLAPPMLIGQMSCYWKQHLGYDLDEATFRRILYDYAYTRHTWLADKTGRAEKVMQYASVWQNDPPIIGLGQRLGPFWFPQAVPPPSNPEN
jgi:hypothetical protein